MFCTYAQASADLSLVTETNKARWIRLCHFQNAPGVIRGSRLYIALRAHNSPGFCSRSVHQKVNICSVGCPV